MYTVTFCLFIVDKLCDSRVFTAYCTALCILRELYLSELHFKCVISKQIACEKVAYAKDILDSFHCLQTSDNTAHCADNACLLASRNSVLRRWVLEHTSIAWSLTWNIGHELTLKSDDTGV